jgi:hypothetical protein
MTGKGGDGRQDRPNAKAGSEEIEDAFGAEAKGRDQASTRFAFKRTPRRARAPASPRARALRAALDRARSARAPVGWDSRSPRLMTRRSLSRSSPPPAGGSCGPALPLIVSC